MGIPVIREYCRSGEDELDCLERLFKRVSREYGVEGVVAGTLLSDYQRMRIAVVAEKTGLKTYTPLWRIDQEGYMREVVENGIKFILTTVSAYGLSYRFLGKIVDTSLLEEILSIARRYGLNPGFEGGEAETLVLDAPLFKKKLYVKGYIVLEGPWCARLVITSIELCDKLGVEVYGIWREGEPTV